MNGLNTLMKLNIYFSPVANSKWHPVWICLFVIACLSQIKYFFYQVFGINGFELLIKLS